jgi:cation transport ATPase
VLGGDLGSVAWLVAHARRVRRVVVQNLLWASGYNFVAVALAAGGRLTPVVAALAMLASSAAVTANARRLRHRPQAITGAREGRKRTTGLAPAA